MKFKAAVLVETNKPLEIMDLQVPKLKSGQVLVDMLYSSMCGTQINEINGNKGEDKYLPHTLGHEGYGRVADIAHDITKVKRGDYVVVTWIKGTGLESANIRYGDVNSGKACTLSEYSVVSENRLVPVKVLDHLEEYAPFLGCCIPTGAGVVEHQIPREAKLLVLGLGGVGASSCIWAKKKYLRATYGYDISKTRKKILELADIEEYNSNEVNYVIDATGNINGFKYAWDCLSPDGSMIIVGNPPKGTELCIDPFDLIFGKSLHGSAGGRTNPDIDIPNYACYLESFKDIKGNMYNLEDINLAISRWGKEGKPIFRM